MAGEKLKKHHLKKIAQRDSELCQIGDEPSNELLERIRSTLKKRRKREHKRAKGPGKNKSCKKNQGDGFGEPSDVDDEEGSAPNPVFAAGFSKLFLTADSPLFLKVLEEAAKMTVNEQWDFVLQQLADDVSQLGGLFHERRVVDPHVKLAGFKPRIRLVLFVEALSRAYESKRKSALTVDDVALLNELVPWREPRQLFEMPKKHADFLRGAVKELTVRQYFNSLDDVGCLPFLSEVIEDYSALAQVFQERVAPESQSLHSLGSFLFKFHQGLGSSYVKAALKEPAVFCLRPLVLFASKGPDFSKFLQENLARFQRQSDDDAAEAAQTLHDLARLTSFESI